ncbi:MAG TPA: CBASS oligonucleotide cyclase [Chitinophagaceae bacterium]|jgi:hypothetical protein|nr:CBASS oligonucleotide cyclase [Chitinophagaceae bacterium]
MGSGGAFSFSDASSDEILKKISSAESVIEREVYNIWVSNLLDQILSQLNNRDTDLIQQHIQTIIRALNDEIEGVVTTLFGGSISKRTHLDGLSDVDTLIVLNRSELADKSPQQVLKYFYDRLYERFSHTEITLGDKTVTLRFSDVDVQLLPAIKFKNGVKIPDGIEWSPIISPSSFVQKLTDLNGGLNGRLIPTIKIVKGIIAGFPINCQLKGYHIESLAIEIFKGGTSSPTFKVKDLIIDFFRESPKYVRRQIKDVTNQSEFVDEYLGKADSVQRLIVGDLLERTYRQIELAETGLLKSTWVDLLAHI